MKDYERPYDRWNHDLVDGDQVKFTGPPDVSNEQMVRKVNKYAVNVGFPEQTVGKVRIDDGKAASDGHVWVSFEGGEWIRMPSSHIEKVDTDE